jgi:aldehyde:ferredoxin oxidoreductase
MTISFHNKILRVNLTTGAIIVDEPGAAYFRRYLGGWNVIADVLIKEVPVGTDPLGPANKLIFAPGVLTGLAISGATRSAVGGKSPLTGAFGATEMGGFWSADLKRAGFDAIIVEGAAKAPVYLWIKDGKCEIRDASHLWGKTTKETQQAIRDELGDQRINAAMIGPGGESMVKYACVMDGLKDAAGRTGMGAVMGSKKLKAIAARGTINLDGADADTVRAMAQRAAREVREGTRAAWAAKTGTGGGELKSGILQGNMPIRNFRDGEFPEIEGIEYICDKIGIGMEGCWSCAVRCKKVVAGERPGYTVDSDYGGPEYETIGSLGSTCGLSDPVALSKANELCNAYSLDTIGAGVTIAFGMECYENGLITKKDTGGIDLKWGDGDAILAMIEKIVKREDIGDALAEDLVTAAKRIGGNALDYAVQTKGQAFPMHEPRVKRGLAIGYALSPTGADHVHALHDTGMSSPDANGFNPNGELRSMGVLNPIPLEDIGPDKVRATIYSTINGVTFNCLSMCIFPGWNITEMKELVRAATGWDVTEFELLKVGERALTLARVYNMREGFTVDDDTLCERSFGPTRGGALADGGIDREELREAVHTYYGMMGWNRETGVPTVDKLQELDVAWAEAYLPKK